MNRMHALVVAVLLGVAAVAGTFAALSTASLGMASNEATVSDAQIAERKAKLDKAARALRRAAKRKPPRLPAVPAGRASAPAAAAAPAPAPAAGGGTRAVSHDDDDFDNRDDDRHEDDDHDDDDHDDDDDDHDDDEDDDD